MSKKTKRKATSVIVMCITAAFFLGLGLGALLNAVLIVMALMIVAGAAVGFYIDRRNGITYTKPR
jgi:uncharacterized membrane protein YoaK (UPF0700 family)